MKKHCRGFSLVETLMALGVVSGGLLVLLGVLSATIQGAHEHDLRRSANEAVNAVLSHLEERGGHVVAGRLLLGEEELANLAAWDDRKLFVDRETGFVGTHDEIRSRGYDRFDQAHYFEAVLVKDTARWSRGDTGGPESVIFSIRFAWPASRSDGTPTPHGQRSRLTVRACLPR